MPLWHSYKVTIMCKHPRVGTFYIISSWFFLLSTQVFVFWVHYWDPHHFVELFKAKVFHEDFGMISCLPMLVDLLVVFAMFSLCYIVATLALGSRPKQGLARLWAKRGSMGVKASVREWTFTLPRELPPWELESRWTLECSKSDYKGQNLMDWRIFLYHWKTIEMQMSQMGLHDSFGHLKHKLWPKEGPRSNLTPDH